MAGTFSRSAPTIDPPKPQPGAESVLIPCGARARTMCFPCLPARIPSQPGTAGAAFPDGALARRLAAPRLRVRVLPTRCLPRSAVHRNPRLRAGACGGAKVPPPPPPLMTPSFACGPVMECAPPAAPFGGMATGAQTLHAAANGPKFCPIYAVVPPPPLSFRKTTREARVPPPPVCVCTPYWADKTKEQHNAG